MAEEKNIRHAEIARDLFENGANCAQAVFAAFGDVTGIDKETALKLSSSFGGGMGRMREVCGACSGMFMAAGLLFGYSDLEDAELKKEHYALIQRMAAEFKERNNGTIICRELLANLKVDNAPTPSDRTAEYYRVRPCAKFVMDAADILDQVIAEKE